MLGKILKLFLPGTNAVGGLAGVAVLLLYFFQQTEQSICFSYPQIGLMLLVLFVYCEVNRRNRRE